MRAQTGRLVLEHLEDRLLLHGGLPTHYVDEHLTFDAEYDAGGDTWTLGVREGHAGVLADAGDHALMVVNQLAKTVMPGALPFAFIGDEPGAAIWIAGDSGGPGSLPGPAFGALMVPPGTFEEYDTGDPRTDGTVAAWVKFELVAVTKPHPNAEISVFDIDPLGAPKVWMATSDGIDAGDVVYTQEHSHIHLNWAFTAPGSYSITVRASAFIDDGMGGMTPTQSEDTVYKFSVEDPVIVTGADRGSKPLIRVFDAATGQQRFQIMAYEATFRGGVRVATGDVNGDGAFDIIAAPGAGREALVKVYDGVTGQPILNYLPYGPGYRKGVWIDAGNFDRSAARPGDEIVTGPGGNKLPVRTWSLTNGFTTALTEFFAYGPNFKNGIRVTAANVDGHSPLEIVTAPGTGKFIKVFSATQDGSNATTGWTEIDGFIPAGGSAPRGLFVTVGDLDLDENRDELVIGWANKDRLQIVQYNKDAAAGARFTTIETLAVFGGFRPDGLRVGLVDANGDRFQDILVSTGKGNQALVKVLRSPFDTSPVAPGNEAEGLPLSAIDAFYAYEGVLTPNAFLAGNRYTR